jgi:hypothetical protein
VVWKAIVTMLILNRLYRIVGVVLKVGYGS